MTYVERQATLELADDVLCFWRHRVDETTAGAGHRIFPDGCVDIVCVGGGAPEVIGPMTTGRLVKLPADTDVVGVRLRPGVAQRWLGANLDELIDRNVALADLWGADADRLHNATAEALERELDISRLGPIVENFRPTKATPDKRVSFAVRELAANPTTKLEQLGYQLGLSQRQLLRLFDESIGYGPKMLARVFRLQRAISIFERHQARVRSLAGIAFAAGYADQSHFTREFRALAGAVPSVALPGAWSALHAMSDSFKTSDR